MQEAHTRKYPNDFDDGIDLQELFYVLFERKWIIISLTTFFSIVGVIFSLLLPNIYVSKAILVPVNSSNNISGAFGGYKSLAGLAGLNLPATGNVDNTVKAIEKIKSLSFFENNILTNIYLPDLMAFKSWDAETNKLTYNNSIYNTDSNTWVRDYSYPQQQIPSPQESFEVFRIKHLSLSVDNKSGFSTLSIKHQSPFIAKEWTELVVDEINSFYRQKDRLEAEILIDRKNSLGCKIYGDNRNEKLKRAGSTLSIRMACAQSGGRS